MTALAYVSNNGGNSVSIVDLNQNLIIQTLPTGDQPEKTRLSKNGKYLFVPCRDSDNVKIFDTTNNHSLVTTLNVGESPADVWPHPSGNLIYVACAGIDKVKVYSQNDWVLLQQINVQQTPVYLEAAPLANVLWVACEDSNSVQVISLSNGSILRTVQTTGQPFVLKLSKDGTKLYVSCRNGFVQIFRSSDGSLIKTINNSGIVQGMAIDRDTQRLFWTRSDGHINALSPVLDEYTIDYDGISGNPFGISLSSDGSRIHFTLRDTNRLRIIHADSGSEIATIDVGSRPCFVTLAGDIEETSSEPNAEVHQGGSLITEELEINFKKPCHELAMMWVIIFGDGRAPQGFTSWDEDILYNDSLIKDNLGQSLGETLYSSRGGASPSQIAVNIGLETDTVDMLCLLHLNGITSAKVKSGLYYNARVLLFVVNPEDLSMGMQILMGGKLGDAKVTDGSVVFEFMNWASLLSKNVGRIYQNRCVWRHGYEGCNNKKGFPSINGDGRTAQEITQSGTIANAEITQMSFKVSGINKPDGWASSGVIRFTNGEYNKAEFDIAEWLSDGTVKFESPIPFLPQVGWTVDVEEGCLHTWEACGTKPNKMHSSNRVNYGGQPFGQGSGTFSVYDTSKNND